MNTEHRHADILRAIADGMEIQIKFSKEGNWEDAPYGKALAYIQGPNEFAFRVKPEKNTGWMAISTAGRKEGYVAHTSHLYKTREEAMEAMDGDTIIAVIEVPYTPGEGL